MQDRLFGTGFSPNIPRLRIRIRSYAAAAFLSLIPLNIDQYPCIIVVANCLASSSTSERSLPPLEHNLPNGRTSLPRRLPLLRRQPRPSAQPSRDSRLDPEPPDPLPDISLGTTSRGQSISASKLPTRLLVAVLTTSSSLPPWRQD